MHVLDPTLPILFTLFFVRLQPSYQLALGNFWVSKDTGLYPSLPSSSLYSFLCSDLTSREVCLSRVCQELSLSLGQK